MKWIRFYVATLSTLMAMNAFAQWLPSGATSGPINYNGGNVGIGTATPTEKLDVAGNTVVSGTLRLGKQLLGLPWTNTANVVNTTGYIKLITPIVHNESNMFTIRIVGYNYNPTGESVDIRCSGYAFSSGSLIHSTCSTTGFSLPVEIATETRPGGAAPVVVIRLGTPSTLWYYGHFQAEYNGWIAKSPADFVRVNSETTPTPGASMNNVIENDVAGTLLVRAQDGNTATTRLTVEGTGTFSGKVGVGTASPLSPMHINGAGNQSQLYVTNNTLNTGLLSALANAVDNVSLGFDTDYDSLGWRARASTVAWLYKSGGHFKLMGSGGNTVNSMPTINTYQDVDLTTGMSEFRSPTIPNTTTRITGGTLQLTGYPTKLAFGNGQFIQDNANANLRIYAGNSLAVDTNAGGDITMTPGSSNFRVTGNVVATGSTTIGPAGGDPTISRMVVNGSAHFNGTVTGNNIKAHYQDVAEWVQATSDLTPGTVVILNRGRNNEVMASATAYDTTVAGVVSAQPGISLGFEGDGKEQIATTGRVKVRVDARVKPILVGDLLVTSDIPGTAMRSEPMTINGRPFHQPGTIIGKALEPLEGGVGEILVLLSMQ
jgi:hypothetical protein